MRKLILSTERLRHLLKEFDEKESDYRICSAKDIPGPGGGVYITSDTPLTERHLDWLERRNLAADGPTLLEVVFLKGTMPTGSPADNEVDADLERRQAERRDRAEATSRQVAKNAEAVARQAEEVYRGVGMMNFSVAARKKGVQLGLREFERRFKAFQKSVQEAVGEYLDGNSLVMDLILKFQLNKRTVRHGLNVAAFATEMASLLALKGRNSDNLADYFGALPDAEVLAVLGEAEDDEEGLTVSGRDQKRWELFRRELVEIFLAGFMHDCGLWNEPFSLDEGHEVNGAKLIWALEEVQQMAPSLARIVLFHSDIVRLANRYGVVKIVEAPDDPEQTTFQREFYRTQKDAVDAIAMLHGDCQGLLLSQADLRKTLPVALAERYITQTQDLNAKSRLEVINELSRHVENGPFAKYMVVLCNSQLEVIAPRRSYVRLDGHVAVTVKHDSRRIRRLDLKDFEAGSIHHGADRNSPHLVTLFTMRPDGSKEKAEYVGALDGAFWDRSAGLEARMYIPVGRFPTNVSITVTGFMSEEVYLRVLGEYEQEFHRRNR